MPIFCTKCGEVGENEDLCTKCGEKMVSSANRWQAMENPKLPTAFLDPELRQKSWGGPFVPPPQEKLKATAQFNFIPQDQETQLSLSKGDELLVIRRDSDGWWLVEKGDDKGLVPGSYVLLARSVNASDEDMRKARDASNESFDKLNQIKSASSLQSNVEYDSPLGLTGHFSAPDQVDAKANDGAEWNPTIRKLKKCHACKETILGRTGTCQGEIFHEVCLLCKGCREVIGENDEFQLIRKKAYHVDCAQEVYHCRVCDKEILGRVYKAGGVHFHKLCMICSQCEKQVPESKGSMENDKLVCTDCIEARERREREEKEAERKRKEAEEAELKRIEAEEEAKRAAQRKKEEEAAAKKEAEEEAQREAERKAKEAEEADRRAKEAVKIHRSRGSSKDRARGAPAPPSSSPDRQSLQNLGEFDLNAMVDGYASQNDRLSGESDLDSELGTSGGSAGRDSLRLSQVLDLENIDAFNNGRNDKNDRLSEVSELSEGFGEEEVEIGVGNEHEGQVEEEEEECAACGKVLEGEAIGALNGYFHLHCFTCSYCRQVIRGDQGYAEKEGKAYHQKCYQSRFGKRCCRCNKGLKGKVVKALEKLYHPDCFLCFQCNGSLSESFFEHNAEAVCGGCKQKVIAAESFRSQSHLPVVSRGMVGYQFDAMDETQLTMYPGEQVSILQKDDDGWWLVDIGQRRGYVPGSYLVEYPPSQPKDKSRPGRQSPPGKSHSSSDYSSSSSKSSSSRSREKSSSSRSREKSSSSRSREKSKSKAKSTPGLCTCGTQNPDVARFCRTCGNQLIF